MSAPMKGGKKGKSKQTNIVPTVKCPTLGAANVGEKKKKNKPAKPFLKAPFKYDWPHVPESDTGFIVNTLKEYFTSHDLHRTLCVRGGKKVKEKSAASSVDPSDKKEANELWKYLVFGVNAVTRCIEKGEASLVLCDNAVYPNFYTTHILEICRHNKIPAASIAGLSSIGEIAGLRSLTSMAFRELNYIKEQSLCELISNIVSRIPELNSPIELKEEIKAEPLKTDDTIILEKATPNPTNLPPDDIDFASLYVFTKDLQFSAGEEFISLSNTLKRTTDDNITTQSNKKLRYIHVEMGKVKFNQDRPNKSKKIKRKGMKKGAT